MNIDSKLGQLRKGLLEFIVLKVISERKVYAADILAKLKKTEFTTQEGTLYPLLSKLRRDGLLDYQWVESESGPPRKYYVLKGKGKEQLQVFHNYWKQLDKEIEQIAK
jgi:PadR family transcriptional regulator PadR